jgi:hypothetical protein
MESIVLVYIDNMKCTVRRILRYVLITVCTCRICFPGGKDTGTTEPLGDSCFQSVSFLAIVVVLVFLVLVSLCVSLILCYKLRNRYHRNEKTGLDNPVM